LQITTFLLTSFAILLTPGPTNTILAASGAAMGLREARRLPLAEALGYALAIGFFLSLAQVLADVPQALPLMKAIAAVWLLLSARKLWSLPVVPELPARTGAFGRVLVTTLLNPKAMLVGTLSIPSLLPGQPLLGLLAFVALSIAAGFGWTLLGTSLPARLRRHSYRMAAMIVCGFAVATAVSAAQ
jgi:threonine/homoserine/homoserine lactone efflux protein